MAITYSAQAGTTITSALVGVASLATQTGNANQVQIPATGGSTAPSTADDYNSNVGNGTNGLGDTYVGRLCMLRKGTATQEIRIITAASYASNVVTLTVNDGEFSDQASNDQVTATEPEVIDVQLAGDAEISRNKWTAIVEDLNGNVLDGTWSESGTASCSGSVCTLSNLNARKVSTVTFTETITGNGESIVIARP